MRSALGKIFTLKRCLVALAAFSVLLLLFMGLRAKHNTEAGKKWQEQALAWEEKFSDLQRSLELSEEEVQRLERRQDLLASEKAQAEDAEKLLRRNSLELLEISTQQRLCAQRMNNLAGEAYRKNWSWVEANYESVRADCQDADQRFRQLLDELGVEK